VFGDGRPYNVALIVPEEGAPYAEIAAAVARANARLSGPEQIRRFRVLETVWPPGVTS
jgi:hypothetical protein